MISIPLCLSESNTPFTLASPLLDLRLTLEFISDLQNKKKIRSSEKVAFACISFFLNKYPEGDQEKIYA